MKSKFIILFILLLISYGTTSGQCHSGCGCTVKNLKLSSTCSDKPGYNSWKIFNPNDFEVEVKWKMLAPDIFCLGKYNGELNVFPGYAYFYTPYYSNHADIVSIQWINENGDEIIDFTSAKSRNCTPMNVNSKGLLTPSPPLQVYPNPIKQENNLTIELYSECGVQTNISLLDLSGQLISRKQIEVRQGHNKYNLEVKELHPGIYLLQMDNTRIMKIVKK